MGSDQEIVGTVVEAPPDPPFGAPTGDGLYLRTEDGQHLRLISGGMMTQLPSDLLHRQSRGNFEDLLGKRVRIRGHLSGGTLWGAHLDREPSAGA
jgi:hypothetical protein